MTLTSEVARTLKGKVVTFNSEADDIGLLFDAGMKARVIKVEDSSKPGRRFCRPTAATTFHIHFDFREYEAENKQVARMSDLDTLWTDDAHDWLPKSRRWDFHFQEGSHVFDVDE